MQTLIQHFSLTELSLEAGVTSHNKTCNIGHVVGNEMLSCQLCNLSQIVVTLLLSQARKTQRGLTTLTMLLGQLHSDLLEDLAVVTLDCCVQGTISIDNNETEFLVVK